MIFELEANATTNEEVSKIIISRKNLSPRGGHNSGKS
jgi:hypothetical protein